MWDVQPFYDDMPVLQLIEACRREGCPRHVLAFILQVHLAPRSLRYHGWAARPLVGLLRSIVAGCLSSTQLARPLLRQPIREMRTEALAATLRAMPYRKVIMTNTSETQGNKALRALGLHADESDAFERVYGGVFTAPACKPQREAFEKVLADAGVDASRCAMFEDSMKNVKAAKALGMRTIFVRTRGERAPSEEDVRLYCDAVVDSIVDAELRTQMPELFS